MNAAMKRGRWWCAVLLLMAACQTPLGPEGPGEQGLSESEVVQVIEAANTRAEVQKLSERYEEELRHARILEDNIERLLAAEEGLSLQVQSEEREVAALRARLTTLAAEKSRLTGDVERLGRENQELATRLEGLQKERAALEEQTRAASPDEAPAGDGEE